MSQKTVCHTILFDKLLPENDHATLGSHIEPVPRLFANNMHVANSILNFEGEPFFPEPQVGPQGFKGRAARCGHTGFQGKEGCCGRMGCRGRRGFDGEQGPPGCVPGPKGKRGKKGPQGCRGEIGHRGFRGGGMDHQGPQGFGGNFGPKGLPSSVIGQQGPEGPDGEVGMNGLRGTQGITGIEGEPGEDGVDGPTGKQGKIGPLGPRGPQGITQTGTQGPMGKGPGPMGLRGEPGLQGLPGVTGPQGLPGSDERHDGDTGMQGFVGEDGKNGIAGPQGVAGAQGVNNTTPGPQGSMGNVGFDNDFPSQGPPGDSGAAGPNGAQGAKGADGGATGPEGEVGFQGGTIISQGPMGLEGPPGEQSEDVGPEGEMGPQSAGLIGFQGLPGPDSFGPQGAQGTDIFFGLNPTPTLISSQLYIHTTTGDFLEDGKASNMTWDLIADDQKVSGGEILNGTLSDDVKCIACVRSTGGGNPSVFISSNQGFSFTGLAPLGGAPWTRIACSSADGGQTILVGSNPGQLWVSKTVNGVRQNLTPHGIVANWPSVCLSASGAVGYACVNGGLVYVSRDGGDTWLPAVGPPSLLYFQVVCDVTGQYAMACTGSRIYYTNDTGASWTQIAQTPGDIAGPIVNIYLAPDATLALAFNGAAVSRRTTSFVLGGWVNNISGFSDEALSYDHSKQLLIINGFNGSNYRQSSKPTGSAIIGSINTPMKVPLHMNTQGLNAVIASQQPFNQLFLGSAGAGNATVFNSLVSSSVLTSFAHLLGLTPPFAPSLLTATDSILEAFGKLVSFQNLGMSASSIQGKVCNVVCQQSVASAVSFDTGFGDNFVFDAGTVGWDMDLETGELSYVGLSPAKVDMRYALSAKSDTSTSDFYFKIGQAGVSASLLTATTQWQPVWISQRVLVQPGDLFTIFIQQDDNIADQTIAVTGTSISISAA